MMTKKKKKTTPKTTSRIKLSLILFGLLLIIIFFVFFISKPQIKNEVSAGLPVYSQATLLPYNGINLDKPVYIAYEGLVYDVSAGREEFYNEGKSYQYLAGRDSTIDLNIAGGAIIKHKYKVVGLYKK